MAKRIVNKAERNAERYDAKETGYQLYEGSLKSISMSRRILRSNVRDMILPPEEKCRCRWDLKRRGMPLRTSA